MERIRGTVCRGRYRARQAFTERRLQEVEQFIGWRPYKGTLNVRVLDLPKVVTSLGRPIAETEHKTRIGPLRWWPGVLELPDHSEVEVLLVRGMHTNTRCLEFVAQSYLRAKAHGVRDGDLVWFLPNKVL
jgi:CTP-dependent riboflavin kinase